MFVHCPNDESHQTFETSAHVMESWQVDQFGNWISTLATLETTHGPDADNIFTCLTCDTAAIVEP